MTHNAILQAEAEAKRFLQAARIYHETRGSKQTNFDVGIIKELTDKHFDAGDAAAFGAGAVIGVVVEF